MKHILNIRSILILILVLTLTSCKSSNFIFNNEDKRIELIIPNNEIKLKDSITNTYATLKLTNIDPSKLAIIGVGVSLRKNQINQNMMQLLIKTKTDYLEKYKIYKLRVSYKEDSKVISHLFEIPIKK